MEGTKERFNFLDSSELKIINSENLIFQNIQNNIKNQEQKKSKLISIKEEISKLNISTINEEDNNNLEELINELTTNIASITLIENKLNEISEIKSGFLNGNSSLSENLKSKISLFSYDLIVAETSIIKLDSKIDALIKELNSKTSSLDTIVKDFFSSDVKISDNNTLIISEQEKCVFLPYTVSELSSYLELYPKEYNCLSNVVNKEFILPLDYYTKHPSLSRFREAYSLIRDKEAKTVFEALKYSFSLMFKYDLNPAIISACKTEEALNHYIDCLENNKLDDFNVFKIEYKINPMITI